MSKDELVIHIKAEAFSFIFLMTLILTPPVAGMAYISGQHLSCLSDPTLHHILTPGVPAGKQDVYH